MKRNIIIILAVLLATSVFAAETNSLRMVKSEIVRNPEAKNIDFNTVWKWNYTHGLLLQSMMMAAEKHPTIEATVDQYVKQYLDSMIMADGTIRTYKKSNYTLDHINPGKMLIMAYEKYQEPRFKVALDTLYSQLLSQPRVSEGGFWHKKVYPNQMWLDGIYMEAPFYCEYAKRYLDGEAQQNAYNDVVNQIMVVARHTYDPEYGLYRHAWNETKEEAWCNPENGQSMHVWGRALGWYCMAMVDVLGYLPEEHPGRDSIISILSPLCEKIRSMRDKDYGIWYQVMDQGQRNGNYLETSCSVMFAYTFVKGAQNGWLSEDFLETGKLVYDDLNNYFIREDGDDVISITRVCAVAGLGGKNYRTGNYEYYIHEPVRDNDPKAVGPYIMTSLLLGE